jgi:hypothetical protein
MKSLAFSVLVCVLLIHLAEAQPKLAIDSMSINLGTLYSGQVKTGRIVIRNIGNQPLKILHVQPSCGCTTVGQPKSELQPNETDELEISFNSALYHGPVEKYVNIETNDPLSQYVAVKFIALVKEELTPTSGTFSIYLGNVTVGKTMQQPITFTNSSSKVIAIKKITSTSDRIIATTDQKRIGLSDTLTVVLTTHAEKLGYDTATLNILTDSKNQPTVELKVYYIGQKEGQ